MLPTCSQTTSQDFTQAASPLNVYIIQAAHLSCKLAALARRLVWFLLCKPCAFSPLCASPCHDLCSLYFFTFPHPALPSIHTNATRSLPKPWASRDQSLPLNTPYLSVFATNMPPGSICMCRWSLLNQPRKPPEGLQPSVNLGPSTVYSRGWTANGNFLPLPHRLVTQTLWPSGKVWYHAVKTYETHQHLCHPSPLVFSSVSTLS